MYSYDVRVDTSTEATFTVCVQPSLQFSWLAHGGGVCENPWEEKQEAIPATGSYMGCNWTSGGDGR